MEHCNGYYLAHSKDNFRPFDQQIQDTIDFDIVNRFIEKGCVTIDQDEIKNVKLLFKLLSTKPTFVVKTHKELNKLMK
jgi:hypothetical protein